MYIKRSCCQFCGTVLGFYVAVLPVRDLCQKSFLTSIRKDVRKVAGLTSPTILQVSEHRVSTPATEFDSRFLLTDDFDSPINSVAVVVQRKVSPPPLCVRLHPYSYCVCHQRYWHVLLRDCRLS